MKTELQNAEVECLKLKKAINDNHRLAQKAAGDAVERGVLAGELLAKWKELLPHGRFESFVSTHFEGSTRTAQLYMQAAKRLTECSKAQRVALLTGDITIEGLIGSIRSSSVAAGRDARTPEGTPVAPEGGSNPPATASISAKGKPGGVTPSSSKLGPASPVPASGGAADSSGEEEAPGTKPQDQDPRPPRSGTDKPGVSQDYGKCPACGSTKWTADEFGASCAKCNQPHGEPTGGTDEDRIGTQRSKTVKTAEALMRAFDDLNVLLAKSDKHTEAIASCKFLLKTARAWK